VSASGLSAPTKLSAVLCLRSNDVGEALITIPVTFQVQYAFTGFFSPIQNPPALNPANAGSAVPVKFVVAGDNGLAIVLGGSPASQQIDCGTRLPSGFVYEPAESAYQANWKTEREWAGTCRQLNVSLDDGTQYVAFFSFS